MESAEQQMGVAAGKLTGQGWKDALEPADDVNTGIHVTVIPLP